MKQFISLCVLITMPLAVIGQEFSYNEKKEFRDLNAFIFDAKFSPFRNYFAITYGDNRRE